MYNSQIQNTIRKTNNKNYAYLNNVCKVSADSNGRNAILNTMTAIVNHITDPFASGYNAQRTLLQNLFKCTSGSQYSKQNIMLRLIVLDSLYSTNANKSYHAIEEIADEILKIPGTGTQEQNALVFFQEVAAGNNEYSGIDADDWFNKSFGIQKNGQQGHRKTSLLTKYAYYCLLSSTDPDGFPIYDSLVLMAYPFAFRILWPNNSTLSDVELKNIVGALSQTYNKPIPISLYIKAMSTLINGLQLSSTSPIGLQKFDILDAYLWRMGKFSSGNLSLILDKQGYEDVVMELLLHEKQNPDYFADVAKESFYKDCLGKTINDMKRSGSYPTILENKICKEVMLQNSSPWKGNFNALVLYSMMNGEHTFQLKNHANSLYMNMLYNHWRMYFAH